MDRILVTGGAGFIGSHLCNRLVAEGNKVTVIDNLCTGDEHNLLPHRIELIEDDVCDKIFLRNIDQIYHLASRASPKDFTRHQIDIMQTNTMGTENMMRMAMKNNARILLASTSEVYGEPEVHPQPETYRGSVNTTGARSCYDEAKRCMEAIAMAYHRRFNVDVRIARIFNTYGPRMREDDGRVIPNFIHQALTNKPITVYGNGKQTRSFCYVDDMVDGLMALMNAEVPSQMWYCSQLAYPTNLGNDQEHSILAIAELIKSLINSQSHIVFRSLPEDDPTRRCPDLSKAKALLGWAPKITVNAGIKRMIEETRPNSDRQ